MNLYFVTYTYLIVLNIVVSGKDLRIIGGEDGDIMEFPFTASLRLFIERRHFCGGAIISCNHVLTAAHCIHTYHKSIYKVYVGSDDATNYARPYYNVEEAEIHPNFIERINNEWVLINDIAIITVEPFIIFNQFQNKINLPTSNIEAGEIAIMNGWGWKTFPEGDLTPKIQKTHTTIMDKYACMRKYPDRISDQQICAFQGEGIGMCYGDSGGPLFSNGVLVGISSFSHPCATGQPDVFSNVFYYLDFIESRMLNSKLSSCCAVL